ncbi:MAG: nucleotidyl transferase AbiEii/AbiGii toxin family protein [Petrimonas sp.]|uniref:nucleotidyl transferase AbiEii/AbiGii toxin family protein n=1 Tax=Petrimonas sp. TaxID=2023866 RepID=UPI002B39B784|nr:nucleotidyl transferase AbiEii/AbiGii toxin family protein [Petrimonas sp.]
MIHPDSRTIEWMTQVAAENKFSDIALIEKSIRAFSLLESLVLSGCPFVFKGGTALMLHMDSAKRLSIDVDIICPPGTRIEEYLKKNAQEYGFNDVKLVERVSAHNTPKTHAKFFYQVTYITNTETECILLDVLFEDTHYQDIERLPIQSRFFKLEGEPVMVNVPSKADMLGDKLTAFAPNTTGIPYFKGDKDCSMEIIKQLFDIASLFDVTTNLTVVAETFRKFASVELQYRGLDPENTTPVLDNIFQTSLCICLRGQVDPDTFKLLQTGTKRIQSFIHGEKFNIDRAITNASKAAYLSVLIANGETILAHFNPQNVEPLRDAVIKEPLNTKLNKLKKSNIEAFFYWNEIGKMFSRILNVNNIEKVIQ